MLEDLGKLIVAIQEHYDAICEKWDEKSHVPLNFKKKQVIDVYEDAEILGIIWAYRAFINGELPNIMVNLGQIQFENSSIKSRVKTQNSVEFKLENYAINHESGRIPLKKCMNDLFGIRIIIDEEFTYDDVKEYMNSKFKIYKCIDSSKYSYIATHIYFERDNFSFPWELQVWMKKHAKSNSDSHKEYKQDYTKWENVSRGGVEND